MRIVAWCLFVAALIFAGASNRISDDSFDGEPKTSTLVSER